MLAALLTSPPASAQLLWSALDTKPKPNLIVAYDTSVTMQVIGGCASWGCHAGGTPWSDIRLYGAAQELLGTLDLFRDQFIYGGFRYDTCGPGGKYLGQGTATPYVDAGTAEINYMSAPDMSDLPGSYRRVADMVRDIVDQCDSGPAGPTRFQVCEHSEGSFPGGSLATKGCYTPFCTNDIPFLEKVVNAAMSGQIPGLAITGYTDTASISCLLGGNYVINPDGSITYLGGATTFQQTLAMAIAGRTTPTGRIDHGCSPPAYDDAICGLVSGALADMASGWATCGRAVPPGASVTCDRQQLVDHMCSCGGKTASSVFDGSCICNPYQAGCLGVPGPDSCGTTWQFHSIQQAAVCASFDPSGSYPGTLTSIGQAFLAQPDNVVHGGENCRENVALFFTDGAYGTSPGAAIESARATNPSALLPRGFSAPPYYSLVDKVSNAFVFAVSPPAVSPFDPDGMATNLGQPGAFPAFDAASLDVSFAEVTNRAKKGTYLSGNAATDTLASRLATTSFWVPGRPAVGQPSYPDETYLGRPSHLSWWELDPRTGTRGRLICETDWSDRAGYSGRLLMAGGWSSIPPDAEAALGPPVNNEKWLSKGPMLASVADGSSLGRAPIGLTFGWMLNAGPTQPVIVEAPVDIPLAGDANFSSFERTNRGRDRAIYTMAGGYLLAFDGGHYSPLTPAQDRYGSGVLRTYDYVDSGPTTCSELFRYLPQWVVDELKDPVDPLAKLGTHINLVFGQPYTNGQISVRESKLGPGDYATVLVMTEGAGGPHLAALDVTAPHAPAPLGEWALPGAGDTSSAEPEIYNFPAIIRGKPDFQTVVVMPGGDGGTPTLYSYALRRGVPALSSSAPLPVGHYPSSAVCFDAASRGTITDCVVLSDAGHLVRVAVNPDGSFGAVTDLYPSYQATLGASMAGEKFYTHPAVYFTAENAVAYVFGSGDVKNLASPPGIRNRVYRVLDSSGRGGGVSAGGCMSTGSSASNGVIDLAQPGEVVVSPPIVARGVVSFTTYLPQTTGCTYGDAYLYAMSYETCADATNPALPRPQPVRVGGGIPMSPLFIRSSGAVVPQTSSSLSPAVMVADRGAGSLNRDRSGLVPLYFRSEAADR